LDTLGNNLIVFHTELDTLVSAVTSDMQLILFSDVGSVNFVLDGVIADANTGIYYAQADRYLTGSEYIGDTTLLVYDSNAAVVYLQDLAVPEPTTTTLSLLALAALLARRRRQA
ncbi:MAG: PEP-CTERM sorting domain-containing protein, partial [Akkermansia sp.]|nr:PEP-CTERM sorting domain-containing protein [Akkermansia sp.]